MWTGEVERKVWMRPRFAGLIASAQRSMSLKAARERPHTTAFLVRLAISLHGVEIALGGDRKAGLDDVDAHLVEQLGDLELLLVRHGGAGALLAVAQGGVEDVDAVLCRTSLAWSWKVLLNCCARRSGLGALGVLGLDRSPECPGANAQTALRGR